MADTDMAEHTEAQGAGHEEHRPHPSAAEYVEIAVILAVVTALEVALYFADIAPAITVPALLILTAIKFVLVALWYMHLRFDSRLFRQLFFAGLILAGIVYAVVLAITFYGGQIGGGHV
jgi:cytochrome c oxidase subunit IV